MLHQSKRSRVQTMHTIRSCSTVAACESRARSSIRRTYAYLLKKAYCSTLNNVSTPIVYVSYTQIYSTSRNIQNKKSSKHGFSENPRPFWTQDLVFFGFLVLNSSIRGLQNEEFENLKTQNYEKVAGSVSPI